jgi:hypothetical protein
MAVSTGSRIQIKIGIRTTGPPVPVNAERNPVKTAMRAIQRLDTG